MGYQCGHNWAFWVKRAFQSLSNLSCRNQIATCAKGVSFVYFLASQAAETSFCRQDWLKSLHLEVSRPKDSHQILLHIICCQVPLSLSADL